MDDVVPSIKAYLTEQLVLQCAPDIAFHAACLEHNAKALLISGSPGAGKTTLALYLVQHGRCVLRGRHCPNQTGWDGDGGPIRTHDQIRCLANFRRVRPDLKDVPIHRRRDSKRVKYLNSLAMAETGAFTALVGSCFSRDGQEAMQS